MPLIFEVKPLTMVGERVSTIIAHNYCRGYYSSRIVGHSAMAVRSEGESHGFRILIVEDDDEMRKLLLDELADEGYEVSAASDGEDAIGKLAQDRFDLVITDLVMPRLDGFALLSHVKNSHPEMPVIMMTVFGDRSSLIESFQKGVINYLCKPFKAKCLKDAVRKALGEFRDIL